MIDELDDPTIFIVTVTRYISLMHAIALRVKWSDSSVSLMRADTHTSLKFSSIALIDCEFN